MSRGKITHGHSLGYSPTPTYCSWIQMRQRCLNPNNPDYKYYGGRGITICETWNTFDIFLLDMGEKPKEASLDRIDNNGNYCKLNCRWATKLEQARNRRDNLYVMFRGTSTSLSELSDLCGLAPKILRSRIFDSGWSVEKAISTPIYRTRKDRILRPINKEI